jgi:hypothetical protein
VKATTMAAVLATAFALTGGEARADAFLTRFMGVAPGKTKTFACFARAYTSQHLSEHPLQNVKTMRMLAVVDPENPDTVDLRIGVWFRTIKGRLETDGNCSSPHVEGEPDNASSAHCSVACDGGQIDVALRSDGAVRLGIPAGARLWDPHAKGDDDTVHGAFGPDDKLFRLDRSPLAACTDMAMDKDERAAMLRQR